VVVERGEARTSYAGSPVDEVVEEFEYFAYCVLTGTEPEPDGRDGVADLRVIRAIYESAERGERVEV
jgi:xylose dehydrogenase (NAD/NADP)